MLKKIIKISCVLCLIIISGFTSFAQEGANNAYSPYSIFGVGDLHNQGTPFNKGMGGVGIATRNSKFINYLNPASITSRDSLTFMLDAGLKLDTRFYTQGKINSANNIFDINHIVFTVPIYKKSAMIVGLTPYSSVGYGFYNSVNNPSVVADAGSIYYSSKGNGGLYSLFFGGAVTLWDKLSLGLQGIYYFGSINKESRMTFINSSYRSFKGGYAMQLSGFSGKFGIQYDQDLGNDYILTLGATYKPGANLTGYITDYKYTNISSKTDTLKYQIDTLNSRNSPKLASEYGFGLCLKSGERWMVEFNYLISDWRKTKMSSYHGFSNIGDALFKTSVYHSFRMGCQYIPNRNDIRYYFNRCVYRAGIYYNKEYYTVNNYAINSYGITFGISLPIMKYNNAVSLGFDIGQRGSVKSNLIRERYAMMVIGFNISDIWFIKPRYD